MNLTRRKTPLDVWVAKALSYQEHGNCTALGMVHSATGKEIMTRTLGGAEVNPKELAEMFMAEARDFCQDLDGNQQCEMLAFYGGRSQPQLTHYINIEGRSGFEDDDNYLGKANGKSVLAQVLHHYHEQTKLTFQKDAMMYEQMNSTIRMLSEQNTRLTKESVETIELAKNMIMKEAANSHELRMKEMEFKRSSEERRLLLKLAPALVNKVFGREVFSQNSEDTAIIEALADKLSVEDLAKLSEFIPPELGGLIAGRMQKYLKDKRELQETTALALAEVNPEADAAGEG